MEHLGEQRHAAPAKARSQRLELQLGAVLVAFRERLGAATAATGAATGAACIDLTLGAWWHQLS